MEKYRRVKQATDDSVIHRMCFACRISKGTDTSSEYVILLLHSSSGYMIRPQCYIYMYIACPV